MPDRSPALDAAIRLLRGDDDPASVRAAIRDAQLARILALALGVHHVVRVIAALGGELTALLDQQDIVDPVVQDSVQSLIGTLEGKDALDAWAACAPHPAGAHAADDLINAVRTRTCDPGAAAALIGPCDEAADLLHDPFSISFAIQRWGQSVPVAPTEWASRISPRVRNLLVAIVKQNATCLASCLPWLPPEAISTAIPFDVDAISHALCAFADASSVARALHADLLTRLIAAAQPNDLGALTRLACATGRDAVWRRVQELTVKHPDEAVRAVRAAPWDDLAEGGADGDRERRRQG